MGIEGDLPPDVVGVIVVGVVSAAFLGAALTYLASEAGGFNPQLAGLLAIPIANFLSGIARAIIDENLEAHRSKAY